MKPHKHQEVIIAYANGAQVQYRDDPSQEWEDVDNPLFAPMSEYRVKPAEPERIYPKCQMPDGAISQYWIAAMMSAKNEVSAIRVMIDLGIQCECDAGQIVTREEFDRAVGDRAKRDMAIARAVAASMSSEYKPYVLREIIKGVTQ